MPRGIYLRTSNMKTGEFKKSEETKKKMSQAHLKEKSSRWRGGRYIRNGYVYIYNSDYPERRIGEHIFIWEKIHNRKLPKNWVIHHLNGIRDDNRPENLFAMSRKEHNKINEPYKKRIRELELEIAQLKQLNLFKEN